MNDRIEGLQDKNKVYQLLDKISSSLNDVTHNNRFSLSKESTYDEMIIKIHMNNKVLKIITDVKKGTINLKFDNYNFATLYKNNSVSSQNYIKQIELEEKKIDDMLSEFLKELNKLDKPEVKVENKRKVFFKIKSLKKLFKFINYENKKWFCK